MKASSIVRRVMQNVSGKGIVSRVDIDRVDVIPHGSRTALKKVKLSGDANAVTIGDEVSLINVQGEIMAVSSLTFEDVPVSESTEETEFAPKDHTHENIDAGMLDGKHADRFVQIGEEDMIAVVPGDMRMNGVLGSTFDRYVADIPNAANLNSYTATGRYHQASNAWASTGTNYPTPLAGVLVVYSDRSGYVYQTYQTYNGNERYFRSFYSITWYAWRRLWHDGNATLNLTSLPSHSVQAQDGSNEGGSVTLDGAGTNKAAYIDNYASRLRLVTIDSSGVGHSAVDISNATSPVATITNAIIQGQLRADSYIDHKEGAVPATPASTLSRQYVDTTGMPFIKRDDGVIVPMMTGTLSIPIFTSAYQGATVVTVQTNSRGLAFRDNNLDILFSNFVVPPGWGYKACNVNYYWCPSNTATGNCWWCAEVRRLTPGAVLSVTPYSGPNGWFAAPGVANQVVLSSVPTLSLGPEGEAVTFDVWRNGSGGNDTYGGTAYLLALEISLI